MLICRNTHTFTHAGISAAQLTRRLVGSVAAVRKSIAPVGRRKAEIVAQELVLGARHLVAVLLVRVVVAVLEEIATIHLADTPGTVVARPLTLVTYQRAGNS